MNNRTIPTAILLIILLFSLEAYAATNVDEGLYAPLPPEGSAFVRFVHAKSDESGSEPAIANGKTFDYLEFKEISSYFVVPGGEVNVSLNERKKKFEAKAGDFYTVILKEGNLLDLHHDVPGDNRAKAHVILYNYGAPESISLKTSDGEIPVIEEIKKGETGTREINPVKVSFGIFSGYKKLGSFEPVSLERSQAYTAFLFPGNETGWLRNTTNTVR